MRSATIRDVAVGIPTCDDDPLIVRRLLEAVLAEPLAQPPVVVDMSRGDAIRATARAIAGVLHVPYPESTGVSASRNRIFEIAETRYVLLIDADAVPEPGWANAMRRGFDEEDHVGIVGARCLPVWPSRPPPLFDTAPAFDLLGMFDLGSDALDVPRIMGTSYAIDRESAPRPPFSLAHGRRPGRLESAEEVLLCDAVRAAGWSVRYEPRAIVRHYLRPERASWRWMLRRARVAGREARRAGSRPEALPRRLGVRDVVFLAAITPAYFTGRILG
jgi:mycofactocin glycosyltransferase